jgi:hypothetical protein
MTTVDELERLTIDAAMEAGTPLTRLDAQLIRLGVAVSVTSLDRASIESVIKDCFSNGGTPAQIQEIVSLVSGLGVHSLMIASSAILDAARAAGFVVDDMLSAGQQALWDQHVGDDPFWASFEKELPGFLRAMLILSSDQFTAFFDYCAVPWKSGQVRARIKELTAMACDATSAHRFLPGFRLHLANAVALGAGRLAIDEAMAIARSSPEHKGTR